MKRTLLCILAVFVLTIVAAIVTAQRADFWLDWQREVPSKMTTAELAAAIGDLKQWPIFNHSLKSVTLVNTLALETGSELRFEIEPKGKEWKRFELYADALAVTPGKSYRFRLKDDSKKRLTTIFDDYEWTLDVSEASPELAARGFRSVVRGTAHAHTASWRGRLFGAWSPRILMNQVYTVDLVKLGTFPAQAEAARLNQEPVYQ